jgi:hypothetical protein
VPGTVLNGQLLTIAGIIPTGAISQEIGRELIAELEAGETLASELSIDSSAGEGSRGLVGIRANAIPTSQDLAYEMNAKTRL